MSRNRARLAIALAGVFCAILPFFVFGRVRAETGTARVVTRPVMQLQPTPTIDRLAPPATLEHPTQADEGAQLYWLNCQPCHGDRGQGLTEDWIAQYPPEDQNCWESGCHGERPYENGFTLPKEVPALTGAGSLQRFEHMGQVLGFMKAAMPFNAPGSLKEEEYLAITAFLAREHGVWNGKPVQPDSAASLRLKPEATATPATPLQTASSPGPLPFPIWYVAAPIFLLLVALALVAWQRRI